MSGKPAARIGDSVVKGKIVTGSATVLIGDAAEGAADRCPTCKPTVGWPVNPVLGVKLLPGETDFALPAPAVFAFTRSYVSSDARVGVLGPGWSIPGQALGLEVSDTATVLIDGQGRRLTFGPLAPGEARFSPSESLWIRRGGPVIPQADALGPWTGRWAFIPPGLQHQPDAIFVVRGTDALHFAPHASPQGDAWRLVAEFDANGYRTEFEWSDEGRPASVRDSAGRRYVFFYLSANERRRLYGVALVPAFSSPYAPRNAHRAPYGIDPHAPETDWLVRYDYDSAGRLVAVRDRNGQIVREFTWTGSVMAGHSQPGGIDLHYEWDTPGPEGRVLRQIETDGLSRTFTYYADHTEVTDSLGCTEHYHFEGEGGDTRWSAHTRADGSRIEYRHDGVGRRVATIDPLGRTTWLRRDGQGRLTARQWPDGSTWQYCLDDDTGAPLEIRSPAGLTWTIERDARANPIAVTGPDRATTRYTYADPRLPDRPTTITDARGGVRRLEWNALGQLTTHTDCSGHTTRWTFDAEGRLTAHIDALGQTTTWTYDRLGRPVEQRRPDGSRVCTDYDPLGRLVHIDHIDRPDDKQARHTRTLAWDRFGRLGAARDPAGLSISLSYDRAGRLTELTNENRVTNRFEYDLLDRVVTELGFDGRIQHHAYNAAGERVTRTEADGRATHYRHDAAGRLIERILPNGDGTLTEAFRWSPAGSLLEATGPHARLRFDYDEAGRLVRETQCHADGWTYTTAHRHSSHGALEASRYGNAPEIEWLTYGPGHVHGLAAGDFTLAFERDALHREVRRLLPAAGPSDAAPILQAVRSYEALGKLRTQHFIPATGPHRRRDYHWRANNQLEAIDDNLNGPIAYTFDRSGRLIASRHGTRDHHYRFDAAGNRLDTNAPPRHGQTAWADHVRRNLDNPEFNLLGPGHGPDDTPLDAWPDNRVLELEGHHSRFDRAGNIVERTQADGTRLTFGYDGAHRLVELNRIAPSGAITAATYRYDALSRRIAKSVTHPDGRTETFRYGWAGDRLVAEESGVLTTTVVYEPDSFVPMLRIEQTTDPADPDAADADSDAGALAQVREQLIDLGIELPAELRPPVADARFALYHTDHLGTPLVLVGADGATLWQARPDDWGAVRDESGPTRQPIRFQGQWCDEESGLYYNRYRYYDPHIGQYLSQDPIGAIGGINLYTYTTNPLSRLDPLGLSDALYPGGIEPYQRPALTPDGYEWGEGCGDAATDQYVPDAFGKASFFPACRAHDRCYGEFGANKNTCDDTLEANMKAACDNLDGVHLIYQPICKGVGTFYRVVLKDMNLGQPAFDAAQEEAFWKMIDERMRTW